MPFPKHGEATSVHFRLSMSSDDGAFAGRGDVQIQGQGIDTTDKIVPFFYTAALPGGDGFLPVRAGRVSDGFRHPSLTRLARTVSASATPCAIRWSRVRLGQKPPQAAAPHHGWRQPRAAGISRSRPPRQAVLVEDYDQAKCKCVDDMDAAGCSRADWWAAI